MAYDRSDWHYGDDFPKDLPREACGTHIGMFLAWSVLKGFAGPDLKEHGTDQLGELITRKVTGPHFFVNSCDGKLWDSDLNDEGNRFAKAYYAGGGYYKDYENTLAEGLPSFYHVQDTWENFDIIARVIDSRYNGGNFQLPRPWWKFW